jgi:hypothetical protein
MNNQSKLPLKGCFAFLHRWILIIEQPWVPFYPNTPTHDDNDFHVSHGPRRVVDHMNKESLSCPRHAARLTCFQGTLVRYQSVCKTCRPLQCGSIVQRRPSWPLLDMATEVIWSDSTTPRYGPCSMQQSDKTGRLHTADIVQDIICYS